MEIQVEAVPVSKDSEAALRRWVRLMWEQGFFG